MSALPKADIFTRCRTARFAPADSASKVDARGLACPLKRRADLKAENDQHKLLISELQDAVRRGSQEKRVETLKRVTDLFLGGHERLTELQIQVFDDVLGHLIARMESKALIELSERLAPINNAPTKVVHTLARDDEIAIAGPVLSMSDRLTTPDLIEIATVKSQSHLLAISERSSLSEALTETLIERGDRQVISKLAENSGARFSEKAYAYLVDQPEADETLLEKIGLRLDLPLHILRRLLERVTDAVRARLLALATPEKRDEIREILGSIPNEVIENEELDIDFTAAQRLVQLMCENGELDQVALLELAKARKYAATVTALATLCAAPVDIIKQMLDDGRNEPLLVPCKAAGLSWPTLRALLQDDLLGRAASEDELNKLKSDYTRLSPSTAKRLLEFWCEQKKAY
jgi:uncharacterized protein (DUF2336 family)